MTAEPRLSQAPRGSSSTYNTYQGRWNWWYSAIADWMIRHPGGKMEDCAKELKKSPNTISMIKNSDTFKEYYHRRREEWQQNHDYAIRNKLTEVTEASLDVILDKIQTQSKQIPMDVIKDVAFGGLEKLGYGTKGPGVQVNVQQNDNRSSVVVATASLHELEEARHALRVAEASKSARQPELDLLAVIDLPTDSPVGGKQEAEPAKDQV